MASHAASGRSVEATGRTVEQAIEAALARIGRSQDEVEVQILREASRGVLGFGAHDAIVRVTERVGQPATTPAATAPTAPPPAPEHRPERPLHPQPQPQPEAETADESVGDEEEASIFDHEERPAPVALPGEPEEVLAIGREVLLDILERMSVIADVLATWTEPEDEQDAPALILDIIGDDLGLLIGRRGETLRDLQYLVRLIVARRAAGWANIIVDVEGYKQRRERAVRQLARRMADRVVATGRAVHLEPMNSYERRLVHLELRLMDGVTTKSSGEGERRRVGIFPE